MNKQVVNRPGGSELSLLQQFEIWVDASVATNKLSDADQELLGDVREVIRQYEFITMLADGGNITVNDIPWREAYDRLVEILA